MRCAPPQLADGDWQPLMMSLQFVQLVQKLQAYQMEHLSISEARESLAEIVNRVVYGGERVVLRRHGKPVAALVSADDLERLAALEKQQAGRRPRRRSA